MSVAVETVAGGARLVQIRRFAKWTGRAGLAGAAWVGLVLAAPAVQAGEAQAAVPEPARSDLVNSSLQWGSAHAAGELDYSVLPGRLSQPDLRPLWSRGIELERKEHLVESARWYEQIVAEVPGESYTYWRIARNYWRHAEGLEVGAREQRLVYFELAEQWAARGISIDPHCAPCMLWKFVSMGRQATTRGLMSAVGDVREMERLLVGGIALEPDHADDEANSTLGNLYYAGAVFYRVIPDWFWIKWLIGVRGDKKRSLEYARKAVALAARRVDYRVELGAVLLCIGNRHHDEGQLSEGRAVLEEARRAQPYLSTDHLDMAHAGILLEQPEKACGYSRDGFIDLDAVIQESRR